MAPDREYNAGEGCILGLLAGAVLWALILWLVLR